MRLWNNLGLAWLGSRLRMLRYLVLLDSGPLNSFALNCVCCFLKVRLSLVCVYEMRPGGFCDSMGRLKLSAGSFYRLEQQIKSLGCQATYPASVCLSPVCCWESEFVSVGGPTALGGGNSSFCFWLELSL